MSAQTNSRLLVFAAALGMASCGTNGSSAQPDASASSTLFSANPQNFRLSLTDAPSDQLKSVYVNVKYVELRLSGNGKEARVQVARNLGPVDLLQLQSGVTLPMADLAVPHDVTVTQLRMVLETDGNYIVKSDNTRCDLKTPSEQKTGIKFLIQQGVTVNKGYSYSVVADFDAGQSIVLQGNGGCLLKPVLKLKSAARVALPPTPDDSSGTHDPMAGDVSDPSTGSAGGSSAAGSTAASPAIPEPVASDSTQTTDGSGWDNTASTSEPPVVAPAQMSSYFNL